MYKYTTYIHFIFIIVYIYIYTHASLQSESSPDVPPLSEDVVSLWVGQFLRPPATTWRCEECGKDKEKQPHFFRFLTEGTGSCAVQGPNLKAGLVEVSYSVQHLLYCKNPWVIQWLACQRTQDLSSPTCRNLPGSGLKEITPQPLGGLGQVTPFLAALRLQTLNMEVSKQIVGHSSSLYNFVESVALAFSVAFSEGTTDWITHDLLTVFCHHF